VPLYQGLLAELEAEGQGAQAALARIDEALALATRTEERWTDAFLHCIRGKTTEARPSDRSAIEGAHLRIARGDELGAALARPGQAGYQQVNPLCRISTSPPSEVLLSISEQLRNSSPEVVEPAVFSATRHATAPNMTVLACFTATRSVGARPRLTQGSHGGQNIGGSYWTPIPLSSRWGDEKAAGTARARSTVRGMAIGISP
jgi:hypothetical protein